MLYLLGALFVVIECSSAWAQGVLNFSNVGRWGSAPFSGGSGLLGAGYMAHLRLSDGEWVGDPALFLASGLFSGGLREVEGHLPGAAVEMELVIQGFTGVHWVSPPFCVTLGDQGNPSELSNLKSGSIATVYGNETCFEDYCWSVGWGEAGGPLEFDRLDCVLGGAILAHVTVDDSFCDHMPRPVQTVQVPAPCIPESDNVVLEIRYRLLEPGLLELRWPEGSTLIQSRVVDSFQLGSVVEPVRAESGWSIRTLSTGDPHTFFRFEP